MKHLSVVTLPALPPLRARLCNALLSRALPCMLPVDTGTGFAQECRLSFDGTEAARQYPAPFAPAAVLHIQTGDALWKLTCSSLEALAMQPDLAAWRAGSLIGQEDQEALGRTEQDAHESEAEERQTARTEPLFMPRQDFSILPQELRLAVLERLFAPALDMLTAWLGCEAKFCTVPSSEEPEWASPLPFVLTLPDNEVVFLRLFWADETAARFLLERLEDLPLRQSQTLSGAAASSLIPCPVEIGSMYLLRDEALALEQGDVLLPERWMPERPRLRLPCGAVFVCRLQEEILSVLGRDASCLPAEMKNHVYETKEIAMSEAAENTVPESAAECGKEESLLSSEALYALELPVTFELASLKLRVDEVAALAPGLTFALGGDVASVPVLIRIGERLAARGRLVNVGGMPGVQVTSLVPGDEEPASALPDVEGN